MVTGDLFEPLLAPGLDLVGEPFAPDLVFVRAGRKLGGGLVEGGLVRLDVGQTADHHTSH
jgi:hypothetical protein